MPYIEQTLLLAGQSKTAVGGPLQDFTLVLLLDLFFLPKIIEEIGYVSQLVSGSFKGSSWLEVWRRPSE